MNFYKCLFYHIVCTNIYVTNYLYFFLENAAYLCIEKGRKKRPIQYKNHHLTPGQAVRGVDPKKRTS